MYKRQDYKEIEKQFDKPEGARAPELQRKLDELFSKAKARWHKAAEAKDWNTVVADLAVYQYSGEKVEVDPRRNEEYRKSVLEGLNLVKPDCREGLSEEDVSVIREVVSRKAAAFWVEGTPRTTVRHLLHDCIPTGPPVRTPPHHLKGEEADWVDAQLQSEVETGQLERGNSEWASPPFATKEFAKHRRQRKRRLVVDYRRVNRRTLRAIYFVRSADGVLRSVAGSALMTLLDACKGFNQIANTDRARRMLAILARSGQYLPRCLTFGPHNGPEDFAFATDRVFSPGRERKMRFCTQWQIYADDITVRTGRVLDGEIITDEEYSQRVKDASSREVIRMQPLADAFRALGFDPEGLGSEDKPGKLRKKQKMEKAAGGLGPAAAQDPSPYAQKRDRAWVGFPGTVRVHEFPLIAVAVVGMSMSAALSSSAFWFALALPCVGSSFVTADPFVLDPLSRCGSGICLAEDPLQPSRPREFLDFDPSLERKSAPGDLSQFERDGAAVTMSRRGQGRESHGRRPKVFANGMTAQEAPVSYTHLTLPTTPYV